MAYSETNNNSGSNNALYFIVGGLVVLAVIFGLFFYNSTESRLDDTTPAAGLENTVENTNPDMNPARPGNQDVVPDRNTAQ